MEDDAAVIHGLEFQARALTAQVAETDAIRFLVGTQSLKTDNQVQCIDFDDDSSAISKTAYLHRAGEIWHVSASPCHRDVLATCYNKVSEGKCEMRSTLWRMPSEEGAMAGSGDDATTAMTPSLEPLCDLSAEDVGGDTKCVVWQPTDDRRLFSLVDHRILLWDLVESGSRAKLTSQWSVEGKSHSRLSAGTWNPHQNSTQIATAHDTWIRGWDLRTQKSVYVVENAHGTLVRDLNFNPNKQYVLASCGDDCKVKFWDVRFPTEPVETLDVHSHWVWCVRYNHFHDQLVLTSSSDSRVVLHDVTSISSEPFGHSIEDDEDDGSKPEEDDGGKERSVNGGGQNGVIATYEEHEDSVYAVEWSSSDPWLFASLSYDGRLIVNRVPKAVKYRILL